MPGPLALFPLRTVLFPHMPLSLHVFEERYRTMLKDCLDAGTSFGVVAIREGAEVGGAAVPYRVGTLARILHVERLDDGRMNLLITGASRFRITRLEDTAPYLQARIEYLQEPADEPPARVRSELVNAFTNYLRGVQEMSATSAELPRQLPDEMETLSYLVAAAIEGSIASRQQLLEAATLSERVELQVAALRREADLIRRRVLRTTPTAGSFSRN